jgi:hypothetical protein
MRRKKIHAAAVTRARAPFECPGNVLFVPGMLTAPDVAHLCCTRTCTRRSDWNGLDISPSSEMSPNKKQSLSSKPDAKS